MDSVPLRRDDSSYGTGFFYRGNATQVTRPAAVTCVDYDITGAVKNRRTNGVAVGYEHSPVTYYAVPERMTVRAGEKGSQFSRWTPEPMRPGDPLAGTR